MKNIIVLFSFIVCVTISSSCKKYLDAKPDQSLQIPSTVDVLQAVFNQSLWINSANGVSFGESSADNYYLEESSYNTLDQQNRDTYTWTNQHYSNFPNDWSYLYNIVNVANVVLDNINNVKITPQNRADWNDAKGTALFFRPYAFLQGAFIFCNVYDDTTAEQDYGMALRLTSDFNVPSTRSTLKETYARIIEDSKDAIALLPDLPVNVLRPSKSSACALLARTYLSMRMYDSCLKYAGMSLQIKNSLLDYNTISIYNYYSFERFNNEVLFDNVIGQPNYYSSNPYFARIDSTLYNDYDDNDLRKALFFNPETTGFSFRGSYGQYSIFIGIAVDEVYLMRAECNARLGNKDAALNDLNTLMETRWVTGTFVPFTAASSEEALTLILKERRKELIFRNLRWMDIKRLNKEGANIILKRVINGQIYTLAPNDNRYALPLPADIIKMTGMPQNPY
jgi:starch-binding outer membrane protein, SusD/RagB family